MSTTLNLNARDRDHEDAFLQSQAIPWSIYIPNKPFPKQLAFLMLPHLEAGYGGGAGGGKSEALLMAALQYIDVPYYSAIIFRRSLRDLQKPRALMEKAFEWLGPFCSKDIHPDFRVKYDDNLPGFIFPNQASLTFGYMGEQNCEDRYQGAEYCFVAFDEATQHFKNDYLYMFSRMRKPTCKDHEGRVVDGKPDPLPFDPNCRLCQRYSPLSRVPLRFRITCNPGGRLHAWIKDRFMIQRDTQGRWTGMNREKPFLFSLFKDNPYLDQDSYNDSLSELDPITRERLKNGDWSVSLESRFKMEQVAYYDLSGSSVDGRFMLTMRDNGFIRQYHSNELYRFLVIDTASTERTGVAGISFHTQRPEASWTVIGAFAATRDGNLIILDIDRSQCEATEALFRVKQMVKEHRPQVVAIEVNHNPALAQLLSSMGVPVQPIFQHKSKLANSIEAQLRMEMGKVFIPRVAHWRKAFDDEVFIWTGHPHETDDVIDVLSNAAHEVTRLAGMDYSDNSLPPSDSAPTAHDTEVAMPYDLGAFTSPLGNPFF